MYPESDFYQVSGYRAHSHIWFKKYDDQPLIQAINSMENKLFRPGGRNSPIELVLGILPNGASYLYMTSEQMLEFTHKHRQPIPRNPRCAHDFLSLSPIYFDSVKSLAAKVAMYKLRPRNKGRRENEEPLDNSKANRGYVLTGPDVVHYRGYFEQQRTLYRLLTQDLVPGKVGLAPPPWLGGVRVVSLVFGEWAVDNRTREVRLKEPLLVEVGWTDTQFPDFFERLAGASVHLRVKSLRKMINAGARSAYFSEVVEDDEAGLHQRLRSLLSHDPNQAGMPLVVLVHDEDMARGILSRAGIALDSWTSGLSNLITFAPVKSRYKAEEDTSGLATLPGPSIVDVRKLVEAVMETKPGLRDTIPYNATVLHMQTDTKTCAGDDSLLLLRMWLAMAQGLAIDEQHQERLSRRPDCAQVLAPPQAQTTGRAEVDPNDVDPNDIDPNDVDPNDQPPSRRPTAADDFSDDDDW